MSKRFLFVGGPDRLPRSPYLQCKWLVMEESLLHFQIKVGVVVWFFSSFLRTVAFNRFVPLLFYVHVSTIQYCVSYSLNIDFQSVHVS